MQFLEKIIPLFSKKPLEEKTILIIDDNQVDREFMSRTLRKYYTTVVTAPDGESGLVLVWERKPDLIVLDLRLPGISGQEVCQRLKDDELTKNIPVVIVTVAKDGFTLCECYALGVMNYLVKPVSARRLFSTIEAALEDNVVL
jgi:two-component system phosphate regulon response regulator PhoB